LTGFKWIANCAMDLEKSAGLRFVFGYEEALGYTVGSLVRDKDGISAGVLFAELAALLKAHDRTVLNELESLSRRYGHYASGQVSVTLPGADGMVQSSTAKVDSLKNSQQRLRNSKHTKLLLNPATFLSNSRVYTFN